MRTAARLAPALCAILGCGTENPAAGPQLPADVAGLVAKGQRDGWESLTAAEKHTVTRAAPAAADAMRGKPAAPARKRR